MAASTKEMSLALFNYMCKHIVGTEKLVKMKREIPTVRGLMDSGVNCTHILSGSLGEGLEMKGSDSDYMHVDHNMLVFENKTTVQFDPAKTKSVYVIEDTKGVFTKLKLIYTCSRKVSKLCREVNGVLYLSSELFKLFHKSNLESTISKDQKEILHGPCLSDFHGEYDHAFCLHCKSWISTANQWIARERGLWPDVDVMSKIIDHGVLFVPVGCKGSPNEDIEWRISFSVGEKLLIYSFTHTQFVCYALMKILLKDVINKGKGCENVICSYFIKTILFWISEEIPLSLWRPNNLIPCFMQFMRRLIYCVKYTMCPHYFIQNHNLFEGKIEGKRRKRLLENLNNLISLEWRCIFLSEQLQKFQMKNHVFSNNTLSFANSVTDILSSAIFDFFHAGIETLKNSEKCLFKYITDVESSRQKMIFLFWYSHFNSYRAQLCYPSKDGNKAQYTEYKKQLCCILQSLYHDAVTGWLILASLFYKMKQYNIAIYVLSHALSKCSAEKVLFGRSWRSKMFSIEQHQILKLNCFKKMGALRACTKLGLDQISFVFSSAYVIPVLNHIPWFFFPLIPKELKKIADTVSVLVPPVVYAHFLCFLCHYHLKNVRQCYDSLRDLKVTISEKYFIIKNRQPTSYKVYGIALELVGETKLQTGLSMRRIK